MKSNIIPENRWKIIFSLKTKMKYARAIYELNRLLEDFPSQRKEIVKVISLVYFEAGEEKIAIRYLKQSIKNYPKYSLASMCYAHALWNLGSKKDALDELDRFLQVIPTSKDHIYFLKAIVKESGNGKHFTVVDEIDKLFSKYLSSR